MTREEERFVERMVREFSNFLRGVINDYRIDSVRVTYAPKTFKKIMNLMEEINAKSTWFEVSISNEAEREIRIKRKKKS